jgi:hypothetical protein
MAASASQGNQVVLNATNTFRFLDLPLEIREMIYYEYLALVVKKPPRNPTYSKPKIDFPITWLCRIHFGKAYIIKGAHKVFPALCMTSSQLLIEVLPLYLRHFCSVQLRPTRLLNWLDLHASINFTSAIRSINIDFCSTLSTEYVKAIQRCDQLRDLRLDLRMDKGDIEEMIKKLEREVNVEDMASAWNLSVVLELPRLETLFFTCLYDVLSVARYKWLLPLKTWFQTKWTEKHRVVEVNAFKLGDDVDEIEKTVTEKTIMEVEGGNEGEDQDEVVI